MSNSKEVFGNINQIIHLGEQKKAPPAKEEWKKFSPENIQVFLQALKQGFLVERYNEFNGQGKYLTVLSNGRERIELANEEYPWGPMLTLGSENNETRLIKYLEQLQVTIGQQEKNLPDHLL